MQKTEEWDAILKHKKDILSKRCIHPFLGFAFAQVRKATVKGKNLLDLNTLLVWSRTYSTHELKKPISSFIYERPTKDGSSFYFGETVVEVKVFQNDHGFRLMEIANRQYDINLPLKTFLSNIRDLVNKYGERVKKASELGYDNKSLYHAVRLLNEAEEFLKENKITLPRPESEIGKLMEIKSGQLEDYESLVEECESRATAIKEVLLPESTLPSNPNRVVLERLCTLLQAKHILESEHIIGREYEN